MIIAEKRESTDTGQVREPGRLVNRMEMPCFEWFTIGRLATYLYFLWSRPTSEDMRVKTDISWWMNRNTKRRAT